MVMSRYHTAAQNPSVTILNKFFKNARSSTFGNDRNKNLIHKQIKIRFNSWNACHLAVQNLLWSSLIFKNANIKTDMYFFEWVWNSAKNVKKLVYGIWGQDATSNSRAFSKPPPPEPLNKNFVSKHVHSCTVNRAAGIKMVDQLRLFLLRSSRYGDVDLMALFSYERKVWQTRQFQQLSQRSSLWKRFPNLGARRMSASCDMLKLGVATLCPNMRINCRRPFSSL